MTHHPVRVLVTDAVHPIAAEALTQTLAAADGRFEFHAVEDGMPDVPGPGIARYWPCPAAGEPGFTDGLMRVVSDLRPRLIVPWSDADARAMSPLADELAGLGASLVLPPPRIIEICDDKLETAEVLRAAGLESVPSLLVTSPHDLPDAARELGYPARTLRVKPRNGAGGRGQWRLASRLGAANASGPTPTIPLEAMLAILEASTEPAPVILQPEMDGDEINVAFLAHAGALLLISLRRSTSRLGGASTSGTVLDGHPTAEAAIERAVAALDWSNIGNVQLFVTADGRPLFFEFNARAGGGLAVYALAGVDILHAALRYTLSGPQAVEAAHSRRTHYRRVWRTEIARVSRPEVAL